MLLKGQKTIVTGGTKGIGRAIALTFAKEGAHVVIVGTDAAKGKEVVDEIHALSATASFLRLDVSNYTVASESIKAAIEEMGRIDVLVNNAGITRDGLLMRMSEQDWDQVIDVNLKSCYTLCQAVLRPMMKQRSGSIVNISSVSGLTGNPGQVNYAASKAGMIGLSKALAREVASRNIRVNCIAPGFVETAMTKEIIEGHKEKLLASIPMGRVGQPEEIAQAVLFLASSLSSYVTGQVLAVDGGMVMQ